MKPDFSRRSREPELMDQPCAYETFRDCLKDLAQVNVLTLAHGPTLQFLERLRRGGAFDGPEAVHVVDVGSGYGDLLRTIRRWGERRRVRLRLTGVDLNPWSARAAAEATGPGAPIAWVTSDIFEFEEEPDVVVSSLFTHHLDDRAVERFLAWMEGEARLGWFVNDLHRHALPYAVFRRLSRLMGWHRFVQHDGPVSIARAFTAAEWRERLIGAGLSAVPARVRWRFPFRLCVERLRAPGHDR